MVPRRSWCASSFFSLLKGTSMFMSIAVAFGTLLIGQTTSHTGPRVATDSSFKYVDSVYMVSTAGTQTCNYQRNGIDGGSSFGTGAINPDCDVDDNGNSVIVWSQPDTSYFNSPTIYLSINWGTPIKVALGNYPRVSIGRNTANSTTAGIIAVVWTSTTVIAGHGIGSGSLYAQTFNLSGSSTSSIAQVNSSVMYGSYALGGVSSAANGDYVVSYIRTQGASGTGLYVKGYQMGSTTSLNFADTRIVATMPDGSTGWGSYQYSEIACFNNGTFVVAFNDGGSELWAIRCSAAGVAGTIDTIIPTTPNIYPITDIGGVGFFGFDIACKRSSTSNDNYVVIWETQSDSAGNHDAATAWNVAYKTVTAGTVAGPYYATNGVNGYAHDRYRFPQIAIASNSTGSPYNPSNVVIVWQQELIAQSMIAHIGWYMGTF